MPPHLNFAPLENAVAALQRSAERYDDGAGRGAGAPALPPRRRRALNALLIESERALHSTRRACPRRPWFKHLLYAPGFYTGYGVKTLPGVREAIEQKRYAEAESEIVRVARVLQDEAALVDAASAELEKVTP